MVSDDETHVKKIIFSPRLLAQRVFLDPDLTMALPAAVTAATGMDALTHNVESYLSPDYHPLCDGIALEGARIAAHALEAAVKEPRVTMTVLQTVGRKHYDGFAIALCTTPDKA